jgi:hypothetical protein
MRLLYATAFLILAVAATSTVAQEASGPVKVEIVRSGSGYQLLRGGKPYEIRGAGMSVDHLDAFVGHGGNAIRNWTTADEPQNIQAFLDRAHEKGVTVMLCLPMQAERWGFDYDDEEAVASQLEAFRGEVLRYRDHPALLAWIIGNELNHGYTNSRVYDAVNDVARMIHELDPNHPTTTTVAGFFEDVVEDIQSRAPELDFISFQAYGMLFAFPELIRKSGFDEPFMVTEWGAIGYWEVGKTDWGAPIEATSSGKADVFMRAHNNVLRQLGRQLLGSYVFYWGQKQERTSTWFGLLTERGEETEAVDVMHHIWNGTWPDNRAPQVRKITLAGKQSSASIRVKPGKRMKARVAVMDPDGDPLTFRWELKPESDATQVGGDYEEAIDSLAGYIGNGDSWTARITAPEPGAYRLFVYIYDGQGHAAHANIPFLVTD